MPTHRVRDVNYEMGDNVLCTTINKDLGVTTC